MGLAVVERADPRGRRASGWTRFRSGASSAKTQWALLEAIAARLMPQPDREEPVPIVPWIDEMLAPQSRARAIAMPTCRRCAMRGARGWTRSPREARKRHGKGFEELPPDEQDALLRDVEHNRGREPLLGRPAGRRLLQPAAAEGGRRHLLCAPRRVERDRLWRPGEPARLCPARLRRARSVGSEGVRRGRDA